MAERTGWTLEYIESMDFRQLRRVVTVLDAWDKARAFKMRQ